MIKKIAIYTNVFLVLTYNTILHPPYSTTGLLGDLERPSLVVGKMQYQFVSQ